MSRRIRVLLTSATGLAVLSVGGPWAYINLIREDAPTRFELSTTTSAAVEVPGPVMIEGAWTITDGSAVGYRVKEILFGQSTEGVGRTGQVEGGLVIAGDSLVEAEFSADMASVVSDDERRDRQFRSSIMDTAVHPVATFTLSTPVRIADEALDGETLQITATGDLTLRGVTRQVDMSLQARLTEDRIEIVGSLTIIFEEWNIPNPSRPGISTEDRGELEFSLVLVKA